MAGSFDRGKMKLYIDGRLQCQKQSAIIKHTNRQEYRYDDLYLGDFWFNPGGGADRDYNFHGSLDEFCLFNRCLTEQEIQKVMRITQ